MVETRKRQIEDVASELFRERGYAATSVRDIARALDIQGASLYSHVRSKEEVLWSIVDRAAERFEVAADQAEKVADQAEPVADQAEQASRACVDLLRALVRAHVSVVTADPEYASVFAYEWKSLSGPHRAEMARRRDAYEARFRALIVEGIACRAFARVDPAMASAFLLTALNGIATWYRPDGRLSAARIADEFSGLAIRSLMEGASP
jgi:AcrR family transcriptional regulator